MTLRSMSPITAIKVSRTFSLPGIAFCMADALQAPDCFAGLSDFSIRRFNAQADNVEAKPLSDAKHASYVMGLVRSEGTLISGGYDGTLIWWNAETGEVIRRVEKAHASRIRRLALSPDGTRVASVSDDMRTKVWNVADGAMIADWGDYPLKTEHGYPSMLYAVAFSPDGQWLATGNKTGHVLVRNATTGEITAQLETPVMYTWDPKARQHSIGGIRSVAFSADSKLLAVGGTGKIGNIDHLEAGARIEVFRWESKERLFEIEDTQMKGLVEAVRFVRGDSSLISAGGDHSGFVSVWNMTDGKLIAQEKTGSHIHAMHVSTDEATVITVGHEQGAVLTLS